MVPFEINRHGQHPAACLFCNRVAKSNNMRKTAKICDRTFDRAYEEFRDTLVSAWDQLEEK